MIINYFYFKVNVSKSYFIIDDTLSHKIDVKKNINHVK